MWLSEAERIADICELDKEIGGKKMIPKGWIGLTHVETGKHVYIKAESIVSVMAVEDFSEVSFGNGDSVVWVKEKPSVIFDLITDVRE